MKFENVDAHTFESNAFHHYCDLHNLVYLMHPSMYHIPELNSQVSLVFSPPERNQASSLDAPTNIAQSTLAALEDTHSG